MTPLYATLHLWAATRHEWGWSDCMMVLADWVAKVRGFDPGDGLRGTYGHPDVCPVARGYRADPLPVLARAFANLPRVDSAVPGDVALVAIAGQRFLAGALRLRGRDWALRGEGPVLVTRAVTPVAIWGVGYAD